MGSKSNNSSEVCVIIGAGSGMGEACARRFADRDILLVSDINITRLDALVKELSNMGAKVEAAVCDVSDKQSVASLAGKAESLGRLKVLVVTAGISPPLCDDWERIMSVDLVGMALVLEAFLPLANPGATVVCIASMTGHQCPVIPEADDVLDEPLAPDILERIKPTVEVLSQTFGNLAVPSYFLAKRGVIRLCKRQAPDWHARGTRIISISPGLIKTRIGLCAMEGNPDEIKSIIEMTVWKRPGTAEDIAGPVYFLCNPDASFISGCDIIVDGGYMAESAAKGA